MREDTIALKDGRMLGFAEYGSQAGLPVFFFHGTPGSRIAGSQFQPWTAKFGIRVIAPERPGYGLSDPLPRLTFKQWAEDVAVLADFLELDRFHVAGESGGGPFALATAIYLSDRVLSLTLIGSATPPDLPNYTKGMALINRTGLWLTRYAPRFVLSKISARYARMVKTHTRQFVKQLESQLCKWDRERLAQAIDDGYEQELMSDLKEAFRAGGEGARNDTMLLFRPWGLDYGALKAPVFMWHGEADTLMPITPAHGLAKLLPNCETHFLTGVGHLLLMSPTVAPQIVERIVAARG